MTKLVSATKGWGFPKQSHNKKKSRTQSLLPSSCVSIFKVFHESSKLHCRPESANLVWVFFSRVFFITRSPGNLYTRVPSSVGAPGTPPESYVVTLLLSLPQRLHYRIWDCIYVWNFDINTIKWLSNRLDLNSFSLILPSPSTLHLYNLRLHRHDNLPSLWKPRHHMSRRRLIGPLNRPMPCPLGLVLTNGLSSRPSQRELRMHDSFLAPIIGDSIRLEPTVSTLHFILKKFS